MEGAESALVVLVPEADPVVGPWRSRFNPSGRAALGAHLTMLFPFVEPARFDSGETASRIAAVVATTAPIAVTFARLGRFGDEVLWLGPDPAAPLRALADRLQDRFDEFHRYGGTVEEFVPHLTVAYRASASEMRAAARAASAHLPIRTVVAELTVVVRRADTGRWAPARRFPLTGRS